MLKLDRKEGRNCSLNDARQMYDDTRHRYVVVETLYGQQAIEDRFRSSSQV